VWLTQLQSNVAIRNLRMNLMAILLRIMSIILLTAKSQKTDMVTGLEAGADDYLTKPFDAQELRMRLRAGRRILDLLDELVRAREIMREQARKDSLTQLCTRATVLELLKHELDRSQRHSIDRDAPVSVVLADLDHFKYQ
jgi:two-component system, cell cycle response regulator